MIKNIIIAFLLGMIVMDAANALKVPNMVLPNSVEPEVQELLQNYVVRILNGGKYQCNVSSHTILSSDALAAGEFLIDDSGVNKYFVISNGQHNYRVLLSQI